MKVGQRKIGSSKKLKKRICFISFSTATNLWEPPWTKRISISNSISQHIMTKLSLIGSIYAQGLIATIMPKPSSFLIWWGNFAYHFNQVDWALKHPWKNRSSYAKDLKKKTLRMCLKHIRISTLSWRQNKEKLWTYFYQISSWRCWNGILKNSALWICRSSPRRSFSSKTTLTHTYRSSSKTWNKMPIQTLP